jgi:spermidine synthase
MKKLLSYIVPIRLRNYPSSVNGRLEINLVNGRKVLDSDVSNYSFGSLQKILHKGLSEIQFDQRIKSILLLGLGGGSVIETIRDLFHSVASITAVEVDPAVVVIARNEFELDRFSKVSVVQGDAADYVAQSSEAFDLIIVDIFIGNRIPEEFTKESFLHHLLQRLTSKGKILFNTMAESSTPGMHRNIQEFFLSKGMNVRLIERVEETNTLIIAGQDASRNN